MHNSFLIHIGRAGSNETTGKLDNRYSKQMWLVVTGLFTRIIPRGTLDEEEPFININHSSRWPEKLARHLSTHGPDTWRRGSGNICVTQSNRSVTSIFSYYCTDFMYVWPYYASRYQAAGNALERTEKFTGPRQVKRGPRKKGEELPASVTHGSSLKAGALDRVRISKNITSN